jgi:hypothetical protein
VLTDFGPRGPIGESTEQRSTDVRFGAAIWTPVGHRVMSGKCQLRKLPTLFDHLVGTRERLRRSFESELFGRFEIDHERELGWLLDREVGRRGTVEDFGRGRESECRIQR